MSAKFRQDRKFDFQFMFYTKSITITCINDNIGPSIIAMSIFNYLVGEAAAHVWCGVRLF